MLNRSFNRSIIHLQREKNESPFPISHQKQKRAFRLFCLVEAVGQSIVSRFRQNAFWRSRPFLLRTLSATAALRPKNTPPECFCLSYRHRHGLSIPISMLTPKTKRAFRLFCLVEAVGIEPTSENPLTQLSPGAGYLQNFPVKAPIPGPLHAVAF